MAAAERQILSNRQNALKFTGPRTEEGKAASRGNSDKRGLTGDGLVVAADQRSRPPIPLPVGVPAQFSSRPF